MSPFHCGIVLARSSANHMSWFEKIFQVIDWLKKRFKKFHFSHEIAMKLENISTNIWNFPNCTDTGLRFDCDNFSLLFLLKRYSQNLLIFTDFLITLVFRNFLLICNSETITKTQSFTFRTRCAVASSMTLQVLKLANKLKLGFPCITTSF